MRARQLQPDQQIGRVARQVLREQRRSALQRRHGGNAVAIFAPHRRTRRQRQRQFVAGVFVQRILRRQGLQQRHAACIAALTTDCACRAQPAIRRRARPPEWLTAP